MGSFGQVSLKNVWSMLEACAPGYKVKPTTHYYCISVGEKTYPAFPKGGHGLTNPPIQVRHVRKMARFLGILDCARRELPVLGGGSKQ